MFFSGPEKLLHKEGKIVQYYGILRQPMKNLEKQHASLYATRELLQHPSICNLAPFKIFFSNQNQFQLIKDPYHTPCHFQILAKDVVRLLHSLRISVHLSEVSTCDRQFCQQDC